MSPNMKILLGILIVIACIADCSMARADCDEDDLTEITLKTHTPTTKGWNERK